MLCSDKRKLTLCGWLQSNNVTAYHSLSRLQSYLFFYEAFCKVNGKEYDFNGLKGYVCGPIFSSVWGDYSTRRDEFDKAALQQYEAHAIKQDDVIARQASFVVSILSENELSEIVRRYSIWSTKFLHVAANKPPDLETCDFSENDIRLTQALMKMYPASMIDNTDVLAVGEKFFLFRKSDSAKITKKHMETLTLLSNIEELENPVYVEVCDEKLIID